MTFLPTFSSRILISGVNKPAIIAMVCFPFFSSISPFSADTSPTASGGGGLLLPLFLPFFGVASIRVPGRDAGKIRSSCRIAFCGSCANRLNGSSNPSPSRAVVPAGNQTRNFPDVPKLDLISPMSRVFSVMTFIPTNGFITVSFLNKSPPNTSYRTTALSSCRRCGSPNREMTPRFSFGV